MLPGAEAKLCKTEADFFFSLNGQAARTPRVGAEVLIQHHRVKQAASAWEWEGVDIQGTVPLGLWAHMGPWLTYAWARRSRGLASLPPVLVCGP